MRYLIPVMVVILLGIAGYVLMRAHSANDGVPAPKTGGPVFTTDSSASIADRVVVEAEDTLDIEIPFHKAAVSAEKPPHPAVIKQASKGAALYLGPEKINYDKSIAKNRKGHSSAKNPGLARYALKVPKDGKFNLWLRVFWVDDCADSISLAIDQSPLMTIQSPHHAKWHWLPLKSMDNKPLALDMSSGQEYKLTLCNREDDLFIDQILLQPEGSATPEGIIQPGNN